MSTPISPKVTSGATWATIATLVLSVVNSATPDILSVFGKYEPIVSGALAIGAYAAGAYLKEDPLRAAGAKAAANPASDLESVLKQIQLLLPNKSQPPVVVDAVKVAQALATPAPEAPAAEAPAEPAA